MRLSTNPTTLSHAVGTWKKMIRALSSRPGTIGRSYQCSGRATIGRENAKTMTSVSHGPKGDPK